MPALTKRSAQFRLEFIANRSHSVHGGLTAVEALCQQLGLWEKLRAVPRLDWRKRKTRNATKTLQRQRSSPATPPHKRFQSTQESDLDPTNSKASFTIHAKYLAKCLSVNNSCVI